MPTYDYRCEGCGHEFAAFQGIKEEPLSVCPECGEARLRRLIGAGAGIIFKGSGFYETDYKRNRAGGGKGGDAKGKESKGGDTDGGASKGKESKGGSSGDSGSGGSSSGGDAKPKKAAP